MFSSRIEDVSVSLEYIFSASEIYKRIFINNAAHEETQPYIDTYHNAQCRNNGEFIFHREYLEIRVT